MKNRKLGNTGLIVSEIGFGAWGIGGLSIGATSYGKTDDARSRNALQRAFELGINFFDTSDIYGYGHSEELIGEVLHSVREKIVIATKTGILEYDGLQDFSPKHLRGSLEGSLRRLKTEYVDLYQLHNPPIELLENDSKIVDTLMAMKKEGKIRAYGASVRHAIDGIAAIERFGFASIQVNFNLIDQRARENGLLDLAQKRNVGIIARTPLNFGFLSGKLQDAKFDARDHRSVWPEGQIKRWAEAPELFSFLLKNKNRSPVQSALNFCLSSEGVSTVIPGMLTPSEVEENVVASEMERFTKIELDKALDVYKSHEFFVKKPIIQI